jgi:uncharacterized cupredoxin-like copper-binding protein
LEHSVNSSSRLITAVTAAVLLAACGGSGAGGGDHGGNHAAQESVHEPVDGAATAAVTAVDIDYKPATLELVAGEPTNVTIVNEGETLHDFTLEEADVHANVEPGSEVATAVTVDEPGEYQAICTVDGHEEAGMIIDVTVKE